MPLLELIGLKTRLFGPVSLALEAGECVSLSGPSGSGKSRLLRAIADLDPHEGEARLDGEPSARMPAHVWRRQVQLLPPDPQWWEATVGAHFNDPDNQSGAALGLPAGFVDWPVERLSSGERQRLALLRALDRAPRVLLLDEPTANLDEGNTARAEALVEGYRNEHGAAVIWVTHDERQRSRVAGRHWRLVNGRLEEDGA